MDTFLQILGSYAFPIAVTVYLLWERSQGTKEQTQVLSDLKETIILLNRNIEELLHERKEGTKK